MPKIQLSDFQQAVEEKYADFEVEVSESEILRFSPALRLSKARRTELAAALNVEDRSKVDNGDDIFDVYRDVFRISAKTPKDFERLDSIFSEDPASWQELFQAFIEDTSAGEA